MPRIFNKIVGSWIQLLYSARTMKQRGVYLYRYFSYEIVVPVKVSSHIHLSTCAKLCMLSQFALIYGRPLYIFSYLFKHVRSCPYSHSTEYTTVQTRPPLSKIGLKLVCNKRCIRKSQVLELSGLCPETSTKLNVHEFCFWLSIISYRCCIIHVCDQHRLVERDI
jgi:hypothetical protein